MLISQYKVYIMKSHMPQKYSLTNSGFTLIEMIVSLAIFSIIITMSIGALLVLISSNQRLQGEQSVMTNLAFALDSMTREIRTGYNYYCEGKPNDSGNSNIFNESNSQEDLIGTDTQDCPAGRAQSDNFQGISFYEGGSSIVGGTGSRILYFYDAVNSTIKRRISESESQAVISSGLLITDAEFTVTGSDPVSAGTNDAEQPTVTIYIEAEEVGSSDSKKYRIQTTVTQRILDL
jgi:prepilin-type N-terminal cleavage/methylation domain-containing protein